MESATFPTNPVAPMMKTFRPLKVSVGENVILKSVEVFYFFPTANSFVSSILNPGSTTPPSSVSSSFRTRTSVGEV